MGGCWDLPRRYQWLAALEAGHVMFFYWIDRRDCLLIRSDAVCPTVFITTGVVGLIIIASSSNNLPDVFMLSCVSFQM